MRTCKAEGKLVYEHYNNYLYNKNIEFVSRTSGGEATMIYSTTTEIHAMFLDSEVYFTVVQNLSQAVAVTMNGDHIYWSELKAGKEVIVKSDYGRKKEAIVTVGKHLINLSIYRIYR